MGTSRDHIGSRSLRRAEREKIMGIGCYSFPLVVCVVVAGFLASPAAGAAPMIYHLGSLGGTPSYGLDVNDAQQVAGRSYITGEAAQHAFRYDGTPGAG